MVALEVKLRKKQKKKLKTGFKSVSNRFRKKNRFSNHNGNFIQVFNESKRPQ